MEGWRNKYRKATPPIQNPYWKDKFLAPHTPREKNFFIIGQGEYDVERLYKDVQIAVKNVGWVDKDQIGAWKSITLKSSDGHDESFLVKTELGKGENNSYQYTSAMEGCRYLQQILENIPTDIYLVRILRLGPGGRIKFHTDKDIFSQKEDIIRCHIPIITNHGVKFQLGYPLSSPAPGFYIWDASVFYERHLEVGKLWYTNVNALHGVVNNSSEERIHLVIDMCPPKYIVQYLREQRS